MIQFSSYVRIDIDANFCDDTRCTIQLANRIN